jgi:hypothetical protein
MQEVDRMLHGGARSGAGRPKGSRLQRTAKLAIEIATAGIQPIGVVLSIMRNAREQQDYKTAAEMAEIALPYTTPRLASTKVMQKNAIDELSLDELCQLLAVAEAAAEAQERAAAEQKPDQPVPEAA